MTSILLQDYVKQVDKLIDDNRLVEAIEHSRHILHSYPRHIDTYRVMGKALLEKQDYDAASDLFLRILGADPNDFISHVGLSIIYKEEQQYDQALWHLERAYEIQPYNVAIQGELRKLYADQADARPGIIPLTPGALARLYMQGELYQQAISELRRILKEDPSRMDLQVLLAEAYWRDDQRIDAEEVCLNVLSELPNCIVLNAILSEIWLQTGRVPEARKYLQRLQGLTQQTKHSLDKETIAGKAFATEGAFPLPEQATLEFLETGMAMPTKLAAPTDDWVGEVQFDQSDEDSRDGVVLEPESGMHSYDWLADIGETGEGETAVPNQVDSETDWFSQDKAKDELNISTGELNAEWLADLRGDDDEADFQPLDLDDTAAKAEASEVAESDWFIDEDDDADEVIAGLDDELDDLPAETEAQIETDEEDLDWLDALADDKPSLQIDSTNLMDESLMNWADEKDEDEGESEPHVVQEPKTPFWLSKMTDEELEAVQLNPEEALDWLGEAADDAEALEVADSELDMTESVTQPEAPTDQDAESMTPETDGLGEADDWLAELTDGEIDTDLAGETDEPAETIQLDTTMDELAALSDADDWMESAAADLDAILESEEIEEEEFPNLAIPELEGDEITDIPEWLDSDDTDPSDSDLSEESEAAVSSENDPQAIPQPEEPRDEPGKDQEKEDSFDWLDDLTPESADIPSEPPIDTEGMPSWMEDADDDESVEVVDEWDSQSADIPGWLQEPVDLSDLDESDDSLEESEVGVDDVPGLTGLLAEMETTEEALPLENLNDMDSLFSDWVDEDDDSSLADLVDELEGETDASGTDLPIEESWEETAVSPQPEQTDEQEEPEEVGLTGLLANLNIPDVESDSEADETDDDFLADLLTDADEVDLGDFLSEEDDTLEPAAEQDDAVGLDELDLENVSLTQLLSEADVPEEPAEMSTLSDADEDDWLSDLADLTDAEEEPEPQAAEEEAGLTGMLANLWSDEERDASDALHGLEDEAADEMSLTELLAGIDYAEDAVDSEVDLPDFDMEPEEPPLAEIFPESEEMEEDLPVSAEDTTWLMQLEEDTGSLSEQADEFDMAEETGLDWLTTPDEPEAEADVEEEVPDEAVVEEASAELDGTAEEWDDAMSWLEELAAQQDEPVGELPSVAETMLDEELDTPAELEADLEEESDLDWLAELTEGETSVDLDVADEAPQPELPELAEEEDQFDLDDLAGDEEFSWLDELTTGRLESSVSEEPETVAEPVEEPEPSGFEDDSWLDELADEADEEALPEFADLPESLDEAEELADLNLDVSETDLDWLDTAVEEPEEIAEELDTAVPDEEEQKPLSEEDYKIIGVTDALKESSSIEEAEADLEEALAWLDELDEEGEAELADEAPPTLLTPTAHDEQMDDEPEPETIVVTPEPDELALALDRLEQQVKDEGVAVPETAVSALSLSTAELNDALDWIEQMEAAPAVETETEAVEEEPAAVDESVPVTETEEPVAETAVTEEPAADDDEMDLAAMSEDPEAWLEQLLSGEEEMAVEMEPPPIKPSEDAVFATDDAAQAGDDAADVPETAGANEEDEYADSLFDDVIPEEVPDDPDAAVAWLDQLLDSDDDIDIEMEPPPIKPSEDAVYVTDARGLETEPELEIEPGEADEEMETAVSEAVAEADEAEIAEFNLEDDPEAWLEQLLGDEMSLDVDMEPPPIKPSEDAVFVTGDARGVETEPELEIEPDEALDELDTAVTSAAIEEDEAEAAELSLEDDPEAWLEQLLSGDNVLDVDMEPPPIKPSEDAVYVTDNAPTAESVDTAFEEATTAAGSEALDAAEIESEDSEADIIADVPDDPDEAMAWLEQLAARQGADLEELPSVSEAEAESEMPDWMAQDLEELTAEPDLELAKPVEEDAADEETAVSLDTSEIAAEDEDIDSELPDWLDEEPRGRVLGQTDWLRALPEVDVDTWLSAEEEATITGSTDEIILPDTGPLTSRLETTPAEEDIDEDVLFEPVMEPSTGAYSVDEAKLNMAQQSLADGRINEAISQFKELVAAGSGMMSIIAELEQAAEAHSQAPALSQVLGDAYMRNGQLQKALASYRAALDQM